MATTRTKIAAAERSLRVLRAKQKRIDRRDETRRKILHGAAVLNLLEAMSLHEQRALLARIHAQITRLTDRELLALDPLPEPAKPEAPDTSPGGAQEAADQGSLPFG